MTIVGSQVAGDRRRSSRFRWLVLLSILGLFAASPPAVAIDCGECDAGCQLEADAFSLMEAYAEDKGGFAARSNKCAATDEVWTEIYENIREMDQPPPKTEVTRRREVSKFELAMINHELGISYCLLLCGHERFQENCIAGPGGKSCDCKPGATAYCRSQANRGVVESIAPSYAATMGSGEQESSEETTRRHAEDTSEPDPEPTPEADEEPLYVIEVAVSVAGFEPVTVTAPCHVEPSSVTVEGKVIDDSMVPVAGARVSLVGLGATMTTDGEGRYSLTARTEGDTPFRALRNIVIARTINDLRATVAPSSTVWANGREIEAVLTVIADGEPYAGKMVTLADWRGFHRGGSEVDHVVPGRTNHQNLVLDDAGQARFRFFAPVVPEGKKTLEDPASLFPVEGHFRIMVPGQDVETECDYQVENPFPRIARLRVPGNVDVGLWQVRPSIIEIDDPDSGRFTVTVRGVGDFRTTRPGAATKKGILTTDLDSTHFEFLYRPPKSGLDPTALPDELDQFMNTNMKIYISVTTNVAGGMLLDELQVFSKPGVIDKVLALSGTTTDAAKVLDAASNVANVWNTLVATHGVLSAKPEDENDLKPEEAEKLVIAGGDFMVGAVDTSMGFAQTLKSPQAKLKWEAAKAYWEYLKLINSIQNQYEDLATAYQGTLFYPIQIAVEDERGHRAISSRACSVRVWNKGSE